jgi:Ca2+-binding RTX toxin-like protein
VKEADMAIRVRWLTDGDDVYRDGDLATEVHGLAGDDTIYGAGGNDLIYGGIGADELHGGNGDDRLEAGMTGGDVLYGDAGNDRLNAYEKAGDAHVYGGSGNDVIRAEAMRVDADGGLGNDDIVAEAPFDEENSFSVASGGAGNDRIQVSASVSCGAYGGDGDDVIGCSGYSESYVDVRGGAGNDTIGVSGGIVDVFGEDGNDTISVEIILNPQDGTPGGPAIWGGAGNDRIVATAAAINAKGEDGNDVLIGSNSVIDGANDYLYGLAGNDRLNGRAGDDKLGGGYGIDTMTGGVGRDIFDVNAGDTGVGLGRRDIVTDFARGQDRIDLVSIDAKPAVAGNQAFAFIGTRAFTAAGQVRYSYEGDHTVVQASTDADRVPELELQLSGHVTLTASDFYL